VQREFAAVQNDVHHHDWNQFTGLAEQQGRE
jgi:hypothetical protein